MVRNTVSLFSGAGGLDLGLEAAGFYTRLCVDINSDSCETVKLNRNWNVVCDDICNISSRELIFASGLKKREVDLLLGGPPCQPFSKSGFWLDGETLRMKDPRANTIVEYLRVVNDLLPKVFLFENVPGFGFKDRREGLDHLLKGIRRINKKNNVNYKISTSIMNAVEFGVPQRRERIFVVGFRIGDSFAFPQITHSDLDEDLDPFVTAWDCIGDIDVPTSEKARMSGKWAKLLPCIPEGKNYQWYSDRGGGEKIFPWRSRYWNFLLKLAKDQPSWTIQASPGPATGPFHWSNRQLTISELARLQTFPTDYNFYGDYRSARRQIGNAVPPLLAELIGKEIRRQLFRDRVWNRIKLTIQKSKKPMRRSPYKKLGSREAKAIRRSL